MKLIDRIEQLEKEIQNNSAEFTQAELMQLFEVLNLDHDLQSKLSDSSNISSTLDLLSIDERTQFNSVLFSKLKFLIKVFEP